MILVSRLVVALIGVLGAYQGGQRLDFGRWFDSPWKYIALVALTVVGALAGLLVGGFIGRWLRDRMAALDRAADKRSAAELTVGAIGLVVGLVAAALAGVAVAQLPIVGPYLLLPVVLVVAYLFSRIAARRHVDILRLIGIRPRREHPSLPPRVIDTSAIIDGRLVDVVKTRFLGGPLVVPQFEKLASA